MRESTRQHCPAQSEVGVKLTALTERSVKRGAGTLAADVLAGEHPDADLAVDKSGLLSLGHRRGTRSGSCAGGEDSEGEQSDDTLEVEHLVLGF